MRSGLMRISTSLSFTERHNVAHFEAPDELWVLYAKRHITVQRLNVSVQASNAWGVIIYQAERDVVIMCGPRDAFVAHQRFYRLVNVTRHMNDSELYRLVHLFSFNCQPLWLLLFLGQSSHRSPHVEGRRAPLSRSRSSSQAGDCLPTPPPPFDRLSYESRALGRPRRRILIESR